MQEENGDCDQRLRLRIARGDRGALQAAITLMERHDPCSWEEALALARGEGPATSGSSDIVAEAWDRYFHMRDMSWD
ncbi:MAG: hypothetical protein WA862_12375 [Solirubrobacterales bacterium]